MFDYPSVIHAKHKCNIVSAFAGGAPQIKCFKNVVPTPNTAQNEAKIDWSCLLVNCSLVRNAGLMSVKLVLIFAQICCLLAQLTTPCYGHDGMTHLASWARL